MAACLSAQNTLNIANDKQDVALIFTFRTRVCKYSLTYKYDILKCNKQSQRYKQHEVSTCFAFITQFMSLIRTSNRKIRICWLPA